MKISVIIPTRNEEENIVSSISRVRRGLNRNSIEIIVADGRSSDRTVEVARGIADKVIRISQAGRALQMQEGARAASGDLLLFLHADTRLPTDWKEELTQAWSSIEKPVATAFTLGFDSERPFYRLLAWTANLRTALTGVPHGDQAIAVNRETFLRVGGFPPAPLMEEYLLISKLKPLGRVVILSGRVTTSVRRYERNGRLFNALRNTVPPLSPAQAAKLYVAFVKDTMETARGAANCQADIFYDPSADFPNLSWLEAASPLPFFSQKGDDLGKRLDFAFDETLSRGAGKAMAIGSDTPHITPAAIERAFSLLERADVVLGPAADGGYYLIGLKEPCGFLFQGISWSTVDVLRQTLELAKERGLKTAMLPTLFDVDTVSDLRELAKRVTNRAGTLRFTRPVLDELSAQGVIGDAVQR